MLVTASGGMLLLFVVFRVLPGDPILVIMGGEGGLVDPARYAAMRHELHLDEPIPLQFVIWLGDLALGDLGTSYQTGHPVAAEIGFRLPTTLTLVVMALAITILFAVPMGILAALRQDSWVDYVLRIFGLGGLSMPSFWIGILVVLLLATVWHWFPPASYAPPFREPWVSFQQLVFPAVVLGFRAVGVAMRVLRSSVLEELHTDYARTGHAKGLQPRIVMLRHILPNAFLPTLTYFGLEAATLLSGSIVVESIFNVPGIGQLLIAALQQRDLPLVQGIVLVVLGLVMLVNLVVDLAYGWVDPRIRYE